MIEFLAEWMVILLMPASHVLEVRAPLFSVQRRVASARSFNIYPSLLQALKAPPQTDTLAQRALEEWERTLCENKAVAILAEVQAGRPTSSTKMVAKCSLPLSLTGH